MVACHCGGTGDRGLFAPWSSCPGSSWRQGSHLPYTSTGLHRQQRQTTIRTVPGLHVSGEPSATEVAVRAVLVGSPALGAAVQRRPHENGEVTGPWSLAARSRNGGNCTRRHRDNPPVTSMIMDIEQGGGRSPNKEETSISQQASSEPDSTANIQLALNQHDTTRRTGHLNSRS